MASGPCSLSSTQWWQISTEVRITLSSIPNPTSVINLYIYLASLPSRPAGFFSSTIIPFIHLVQIPFPRTPFLSDSSARSLKLYIRKFTDPISVQSTWHVPVWPRGERRCKDMGTLAVSLAGRAGQSCTLPRHLEVPRGRCPDCLIIRQRGLSELANDTATLGAGFPRESIWMPIHQPIYHGRLEGVQG